MLEEGRRRKSNGSKEEKLPVSINRKAADHDANAAADANEQVNVNNAQHITLFNVNVTK